MPQMSQGRGGCPLARGPTRLVARLKKGKRALCGEASLSVGPPSFRSVHKNFLQKLTGQGLKSRKTVPRARRAPLGAWSPPSPVPSPAEPVLTPWTRPSTPPREERSGSGWRARGCQPPALPVPSPAAWPCTREAHRPQQSDRPAARSAPAAWPTAEMNNT